MERRFYLMSIKTIASAALAALAMPLLAVDPVAVWDGDFTVTQTGYTLNRSGNAISQDNSTITIDQSVGVKVDFTTGFASAMTVMFKYSDLAFDAQKTLATSFCSGGDENRTGVYAASGGTINGIWNTADWAHPAQTLSASSGVLAFCYHKSNGTSLYYISADGTRAELFNNSDLKASGDTAINGCTIGGERAKANATLLSAATGMKITGIAIFNAILTEAEMTGYIWPSEIQTITVNDDTSVSAINAQYDSTTYKAAKVTVASGVTITVDAAFSTALPIAVSSTGSITLSAESQPDASYFTGVDFSGVQGAVLRSWLSTPGVVGFNFNSANGTDTSAALVAGTWQANASDASGTADLFDDGLSTLTWSSATLYQRSTTSTMLDGYLDDGANGGNGATITLSGVPYETYDVVIYASTDSGSAFTAKTVNETSYTWDSVQAAVVAGSSSWGSVGVSTAIYGINALRITDISGPLTICGGARNSSLRGGIAAIQIMPPTAEDIVKTYTLTLDGTATSWSTGTWTLDGATVSAPTAGNVVINATASTTLTIDADVTLGDVTVNGGANIVVNLALGEKTAAEGDTAATYYSFFAGRVAVDSGVLQQGSASVLGSTPVVTVADGATFDLNAFAMNAATAVYVEGAGAGDWPWALTSSGGEFPTGTLRGFTLTGDATIGGANKIGCGKSGAASYLGFSTYTLTKIGGGELSFTNIRSATGSTGTFDIAGGSVTLNEYTNLDGSNADGDPWAKTEVIVREGASLASKISRWVWVGSLVLDGGEATTTSSYIAMQDGFAGAGTLDRVVFKGGASALLTGDLNVTSAMVLNGNMSFLKDQTAASDVVVTPAALTASTGTITVGSGVKLNLGENRPEATITVQDGGTLAVQLQNATDVIALSTSAQPANVILYDANGNEVSNPRISYSDGTLTIMPPVPTLEVSEEVAFDTASNWENSVMPASGDDAIISISGDTAITVTSAYTLGSLTITGSGVVTFSGNGTITAANISVKNGAAFVRNATISATTGISIDSGTVLRLDGVTESAAISGAGAVETYGNVLMNGANTFTGGITVKSGSLLSTESGPVWENPATKKICASAFGPYDKDWAYSALSRVVVENGGCVDINNVANKDVGVQLVLAGNGILSEGAYSGAVKYSGSEAIGNSKRQLSSIALSADAMVDVGPGWGLIHSGNNNAMLNLAGHTLTIRGAGNVPIVNVDASSSNGGTIVLDGASIELLGSACNFTGIDIILKGSSAVKFTTAPTAIGSLTLKPSATGTTASNWNLPSGFVPAVDTSNIDAANLTVGQELTLFTAPSATELTAETIAVKAGGRYTTTISGNTVKATVNAGVPTNFMHYDFNVADSVAADSTYNIGNLNPTLVSAKDGKAGTFDSSSKPYYGSNTSGKSPFYTGEMTVTSLLKIEEANNTILWNFGSGWSDGMALIAKDSSTIAVVSWTGGAAGSDVVSVTGIQDLMSKWHLVTIVANANGTTLYVDDTSVTVSTVLPSTISGQGQFGSIHGTAKNYNAVSGNGFLLDDWCVYDATLTAKELRSIKAKICPYPFLIRVR